MKRSPKKDELMELIVNDLKLIKESQATMATTLAVNTSSLQHHMRRTEILEKQVHSLPARILAFVSIASGIVGLFKLIH